MQLQVTSASRALPGQSLCGDVAWSRIEADHARVGIIDGLGHGREAARAAALASDCLSALPTLGLEACFAALDLALRRSRGAAISLAEVDLVGGRLRWGGVGNVEGALLRAADPLARERLLLHGGIVGCRLPAIHGRELAVHPGDCLVFHTDGIDHLVLRDLDRRLPLQQSAEALLQAHARPTDDALIWLGVFS